MIWPHLRETVTVADVLDDGACFAAVAAWVLAHRGQIAGRPEKVKGEHGPRVMRAAHADGYGVGVGDGFGFGDGVGFGDGYGDGVGDGVGYGDGFGDGYGDGFGYGYGDGYGDGVGYGDGFGDGVGDGFGRPGERDGPDPLWSPSRPVAD